MPRRPRGPSEEIDAYKNWSIPAAAERQPRPRRTLRVSNLVLGVFAIVAGLALAVAAWFTRPDAVPVGPQGGRPVMALVTLAPGDHRSIDEVCADYDLPVRLCELSRKCKRNMQEGEPGGARTVRLILRSSAQTCAEIVQPNDAR